MSVHFVFLLPRLSSLRDINRAMDIERQRRREETQRETFEDALRQSMGAYWSLGGLKTLGTFWEHVCQLEWPRCDILITAPVCAS